jgi:hypothetical protein
MLPSKAIGHKLNFDATTIPADYFFEAGGLQLTTAFKEMWRTATDD